MREQGRVNYYYVDKYCIYGFLSLVAGILLTLLLYNFIGLNDSNRIMSKDMLLAIKQYNIDLNEYIQQRFIIRIIELIYIFICMKKKIANVLKRLLCY